jgi:inosine-uridine nucleoside N-ribohydrolase
MRHVILDTDIGTDVDDLLALVFLADGRELSLKGVTTVYGDTLLRARIAATQLMTTLAFCRFKPTPPESVLRKTRH